MLVVTLFFFFNDTATTEIYTLSLHDALPIYPRPCCGRRPVAGGGAVDPLNRTRRRRRLPLRRRRVRRPQDRKSTRLNSSHANISYAVFCLKKTINQLNSPLHHPLLHTPCSHL